MPTVDCLQIQCAVIVWFVVWYIGHGYIVDGIGGSAGLNKAHPDGIAVGVVRFIDVGAAKPLYFVQQRPIGQHCLILMCAGQFG